MTLRGSRKTDTRHPVLHPAEFEHGGTGLFMIPIDAHISISIVLICVDFEQHYEVQLYSYLIVPTKQKGQTVCLETKSWVFAVVRTPVECQEFCPSVLYIWARLTGPLAIKSTQGNALSANECVSTSSSGSGAV